ncbi:hypothetical protein [Desulfitibacter alkalitolerans]|uniref:hypothetical protein n=1 Tax=Desulfitibacter alkalitolerans TaxID=264641 RepID=UPI00048733C3|nr:hypothetical protein [Desulfitibacter alkalitolerans]
MNRQTKNWILFTIAAYILMFMLVPPKKGPKLSPFGFYFGFIQAVILNWYAVRNHKLWKLPGDILLYGIPLLTCISWIPPSIIFAYNFPYKKEFCWKALYVLLFAFGTTVSQYVQGLIGMWDSKTWKTLYTFPLAICTHCIMIMGIYLFRLQGIKDS